MQNSSSLNQLDTTISAMQECVSDVKSWMTLNRLQLNNGKTEAMLLMSKRTYFFIYIFEHARLYGQNAIVSTDAEL